VSFPPLHIVTGDDVLASPDFLGQAHQLLHSGGARIALHLRGHGTSGRRLHHLAVQLLQVARESGALLLINDRVDVALAAGANGAQLGRRSLGIGDVRALWPSAFIGASVHSVGQAARAVHEGTDFIVLGTIYTTASHPGWRGAGPSLVQAGVGAVPVPVVAIGGITAARAPALVAAGARGMAVKGAIWDGTDPVERMAELLAGWDASVAQGTHA
jgi:thiamine-phosphate pyrophosphorylase